MVNVKLDKTGGLTEALLAIAPRSAEACGIMVGCMLGTSLAMAPAFLLASQADYVDLDGPLLLGCGSARRACASTGALCIPRRATSGAEEAD